MTHRMQVAPLIAALIGLGIASAAAAQDSEPVQARVKTGDLNLRSQQGRKTLDARIRGAASRACDSSDSASGLNGTSADDRCQQQMMRSGNAQADAMATGQRAAERERMAGHHRMTRHRHVVHHRIVHHRHVHDVAHHKAANAPS